MSKNTAHSYFNAAEVVQRFWHQIFIPHIKRNSIFDCLAKITSTRNLEGLSDNSIGFWKPSFNAKPVFAGFEPVRWVSGRNFYLIKTWKKSWHFHFFAKNWVLFQPDQVLTIATWLSVNWRSKKKQLWFGPRLSAASQGNRNFKFCGKGLRDPLHVSPLKLLGVFELWLLRPRCH